MKPDARAVLFDLDGTLLDRDSTLRRFLEEQYDRFADQLDRIDRMTCGSVVAELDGFGHVTKPVVYGKVRERLGLSAELGQALLEDFETRFHSRAIAFPRMQETLRILAGMGLALGLVTNGASRSQRPKIEALNIADFFGVILVSEEQGVRKPEPEIYHRAMAGLGSSPGSTWFVGDHPEADIEGADAVGLKTIWKRNACWREPARCDAAIDGLDEIPAVVQAVEIS